MISSSIIRRLAGQPEGETVPHDRQRARTVYPILVVQADCRGQSCPDDRPGHAGSHDSAAMIQLGSGTAGVQITGKVSAHQSRPMFSCRLRLKIVAVAGADAPHHQHECSGFCLPRAASDHACTVILVTRLFCQSCLNSGRAASTFARILAARGWWPSIGDMKAVAVLV